MENLSKENFWNDRYEKYPKGVKVFCDWIDDYKRRNNWEELFNNGSMIHHGRQSIKFHDIPFSMQIGILIEFMTLYPTAHEWEIEDLANYNWREEISGFFKMLHENDDCREAFEDALQEKYMTTNP